jgi:hypothetical protein
VSRHNIIYVIFNESIDENKYLSLDHGNIGNSNIVSEDNIIYTMSNDG